LTQGTLSRSISHSSWDTLYRPNWTKIRIKILRTHLLHHIKQPTIGICHAYPTKHKRIWTYGNHYDLITFSTKKHTNEHFEKLLHSILSPRQHNY